MFGLMKNIRMYRMKKKWRKLNKHNFTTANSFFDRSLVTVGKYSYGPLLIHAANKCSKLKIGSFCSIGPEVLFLLCVDHPTNFVSTYPFKAMFLNGVDAISKGDIIVDDDVWFGARSIVLSGVHIGQGAIIAAGAVVTKDVPPYAIVGGVPAKVIKYRFESEVIERLLKIDYNKIDKEFVKKNLDLFYKKITNKNIDEMSKIVKK